MFGYLIYNVFFWMYFVCFVCWASTLTYSLLSTNKRLTRLIVALGFIGLLPILLFALNGYTTVSSVSGNYHESFDSRATILTLLSNGTFRQRYVGAFGNVEITEGKWILHLHDGGFGGELFGHATVSFEAPIVHSNSGIGSADEENVDDSRATVDDSSLCFNNGRDCLTR